MTPPNFQIPYSRRKNTEIILILVNHLLLMPDGQSQFIVCDCFIARAWAHSASDMNARWALTTPSLPSKRLRGGK